MTESKAEKARLIWKQKALEDAQKVPMVETEKVEAAPPHETDVKSSDLGT